MKVSLVIPAYNESAIIRETLAEAEEYMVRMFADYEIIVVNDGSTDDTAARLAELASDRLFALGYEENRGKGYAVRTGVLAATGDVVVCTDADLAYGLEVIGAAVELLGSSGAQLVAGSRRMRGGDYGEYPFMRKVASQGFSIVRYLASGLPYDTQCGFKCFAAATARELFELCGEESFAFDFEIMLWARRRGVEVAQMPVRIVNHRSSNVRLVRDSVRTLRAIFAIKRRMKGIR